MYEGNHWINIAAHDLPGIILIRYGSLIPHIELAQSTVFMDWNNIELVVFANKNETAKGYFYFHNSQEIVGLQAQYLNNEWKITNDLSNEQKIFSISEFDE
jgi:alpha-D-xyloside xylohydrolase